MKLNMQFRESQHVHDAKKREKECDRLKHQLDQVSTVCTCNSTVGLGWEWKYKTQKQVHIKDIYRWPYTPYCHTEQDVSLPMDESAT